MRSEYEIRFLDVDKDEFIKKLSLVDAEFVGDWLQKRYIYDFNPKVDNKWIRLRTNGEESTLTIKEIIDGKIDGTKELEILVSDFDDTNKILEQLGYKARSVQENKRVRYMLCNVEIDIDSWPGVNTFIEFEGKNENDIKKVIEMLDLDYNKGTTMDVESIYLSLGYTLEDMNNLSFEKEMREWHLRNWIKEVYRRLKRVF